MATLLSRAQQKGSARVNLQFQTQFQTWWKTQLKLGAVYLGFRRERSAGRNCTGTYRQRLTH